MTRYHKTTRDKVLFKSLWGQLRALRRAARVRVGIYIYIYIERERYRYRYRYR